MPLRLPLPAAIELTATEVEAAEPNPTESSRAESAVHPEQPAANEGSSAGPAMGADRSEAASVPPRDPEAPPGPPPSAGIPAGSAQYWTWPWPVLGAAGAALVVLVVTGLWAAGAFTRRDDGAGTFALRLALIESQLRQLGERPAAADPRQMSELSARLGVVEQAMRRLDDISARLGTSEQAMRRLDDVAARLAAAEQALRPLDDLAARLARVEGARPPDPAVLERLAAAEAAAKSLSERLTVSQAAVQPLS
jgi:hypothetical protein